jgi:FkbM family methyltransferase
VSRAPGAPIVRTATRIWRHPANRGQRARRLAMWVGWQAWERVVRRPWTVSMPPGLSVELAPHDPVTSGVLYCGLPDWEEMRFVLDYLRPGDVMVDVGANVGLYSLLAASVDGVQVVAFEPDHAARTMAMANAARNRLTARIDVRSEAIGSTSARRAFSIGLGPENRLLPDDSAVQGSTGVRTVDCVALDDVVSGAVALLKIDVEGQEPAVLEGADGLLRRHRPVVIVEANAPVDLTERLTSLGYRWITYDPSTRATAVSAGPPLIRSNGIAVCDFSTLQERLPGP